MANPQVGNGYTRIANELLKALMRTPLSNYEARFLYALIWKTYGWGKKSDWISGTQLCEMTGMAKWHVSRTKRRLINRRIVAETGNRIGINKNYEEWLDGKGVANLGLKVADLGGKVAQIGNKKLPIQVDTKESKETNKRNKQKDFEKIGETIEETRKLLRGKGIHV